MLERSRDIPLGYGNIPPLPANSTTGTYKGMSTIPADTVAGQYYILAIADAETQVAEAIEFNNTAAAQITVTR